MNFAKTTMGFRSMAAALLLVIVATPVSAIEVPPPVQMGESPDATITLSGGVVALGVGFEWARGVLRFQGQDYEFRVRGVSVLDLGVARISGSGEVFHLKSLADFEGTYGGTTLGSAIRSGGSIALVKNEHGVAIRAQSRVSGVRMTFSGNGFRVQLTPTTAGQHQQH